MKRLALGLGLLMLMVACGGEETPTPNEAPTAAFTVTTTDLSISVDASASSDSDGTLSSYAWDFGDGSAAGSGETTSHSYDRGGNFDVKLTVTDDDGATASSTQTVTVEDPQASISGSISLSSTTFGASRISISAKELPGFDAVEGSSNFTPANRPQVVAGEVIVRFRPSILQTQALNTLSIRDSSFQKVHSLGLANTSLYKAEGLSEAQTISLIESFKQRADVLDASPNYWHYPASIPDDPGYPFQWHYPAINMPQAWDLVTATGQDVVIAVLDTGVAGTLTDGVLTHPELDLLPGYDFVSDPENAADGDGRDAIPLDTGPDQATGYHGTHVAGTVAARTNENAGVAGVAWSPDDAWKARIVPVRVLGVKGGSTTDINDGVLWAAGLHPDLENPNPADVLNLSLGGTGTCEALTQDVYDQVIAAGKIVVIAAGNSNEDAGFITPANCDDVITVGATDFATRRSFYSNFGDKVNVMAPGGDLTANLNEDKYTDGVLSLYFDEVNDVFAAKFNQGTSMATPHVAGVAALIKSLKPDATQAEVLAALTSTARPLSAADCTADTQANLSASDCGSGLIDAFAALQAIDGSTPPPPPPGEGLTFTPASLDFGTSLTIQTVMLSNAGSEALSWTITSFVQDVDNPEPITAIRVDKAAGTLGPGEEDTVEIDINRAQASLDGTYRLNLIFEVDGEEEGYPLSFTKGIDSSPTTTGDLSGMKVYICTPDQDQATCLEEANSSTVEGSGLTVTYSSKKVNKDQSYIIAAWKDNDSSSDVNAGDYYGFYSIDSLGATRVTPPRVDVNFTVEEIEASE